MTTIEHGLGALSGAIAGEVVLPGSAGYDAARRPAIARFQDVRPRAVVRCAGPDDVVETLAVARRTQLPVAVRSGGHCFAGRSSTEGIVVDVSPMDAVSLRDGVATVGAGTRLGALYDALALRGVTIPAGCGPTVGIAGLTLGGGFGLSGRTHGLTCDHHVLGARVVLADGRVLDCDEHHEPDLVWALRGGGGRGCVVTALRFALVAAPSATVVRLTWPARDAPAVVAGWPHWAPGVPAALSATLRLVAPADPDVPAEVQLVGALIDGTLELDELVGRLRGRTGVGGGRAAAYREAKTALAGFGGAGADASGMRCSRSEFFRRPFAESAAAALVRSVMDERVPGQVHQIDLTPWGGAVDRVPSTATAFAHRAESYLVKDTLMVRPEDAEPALRRLARSWATVARWGSGHVYPNFPDPDRALPGRGPPRRQPRAAAADPRRLRPRRSTRVRPGGTPVPSSDRSRDASLFNASTATAVRRRCWLAGHRATASERPCARVAAVSATRRPW